LIFPLPFIPLFMYFFWKQLEGPLSPSLDRLKQLLRYGLPVSLSSIPQMLNLRLDQLLMAALLAPGLLGLYVVGVTWSSASSVLLSAVGSVVTPNLASLGDDATQQEKKIGLITRSSIVMVLIIVLGQILLTPIAIPIIFGKAYLAAIPAAVVLVVAGGFTNLSSLWTSIMYGLGESKPSLYAEIIGLFITIIGLGVLLRRFQIMGAAVASLLSYSVTFTYLTLVIRKRVNQPISYFLRPSLQDVAWVRTTLTDYFNKLKTRAI